jgi:DNA invertase Pin-like site-specific DNA recombinase
MTGAFVTSSTVLPDVRRAAAYGRISEDDLDRRDGVDDQLARAEAHIDRRGWDLAGTFRDDDISAYSGKSRPGYDALMREVVAGRVDTIVVRHVDRLWRDDLEAAQARKLLRAHRVMVSEYGGMDYPMWTAAGQHFARQMGGSAIFESDQKSERVREAAERRANAGRMNGLCPYGWRREYERTATGRVVESREVVHEPEAEIVREITRRLLSGDTLHGVTADLNARAIPAPGAGFTFRHKGRAVDNADGSRWSKTSVKKLALRESNAGLRIWHKGETDERLIEGTWPSLVEESDWRRLRAMLTAPERQTNGGMATRPGHRSHLLTWGVGKCGRCGAILRVAPKGGKRSKGPLLMYVCTSNACGLGRKQEPVDELVRDVVVARLSLPDALRAFTPDGSEIEEATERARQARELLAAAGSKLATGEWTIETVDAVTAATRPKQEAAEAEIRRLTHASDHAVLLEAAGPRCRMWWDAATVAQRRALLEALGMTVAILPTTKHGPGFDPESVRIDWPA